MNKSPKKSTRGILNPKAIGKKFDLFRSLPSLELAPFIEHFWIVTWNLPIGESYTSETLTFPSIHLVFEENQLEIHGVSKLKFSKTLTGSGRAVGIKFRPGMYSAFCTTPISELTEKRISIHQHFGQDGIRLKKAIANEFDKDKCIQLIETFIKTKLPLKNNLTAIKVRDLVEQIQKDKLLTRVEQLTSITSMTIRPLQRAFQLYVGVSPKWVINRFRIQEAAEILLNSSDIDMTNLSHLLGYFDQAHFIRDFKSIVGQTPLQYLKSNKQE